MKDTIQQLQRDQQQLRTDNIQVQQQIAAINEMMTELSESDVENSMKPKYNDMVWDHIQAETGINAESVVYEIQTVNDKHIINVRGYYLQGKYHKYPVTIGIKI